MYLLGLANSEPLVIQKILPVSFATTLAKVLRRETSIFLISLNMKRRSFLSNR